VASALLSVPLTQGGQAAAPGGEKVLPVQTLQAAPPPYRPAAHASQLARPSPSANLPLGQATHTAALPAPAEALPARQMAQACPRALAPVTPGRAR
jgi:hypothetical protein